MKRPRRKKRKKKRMRRKREPQRDTNSKTNPGVCSPAQGRERGSEAVMALEDPSPLI